MGVRGGHRRPGDHRALLKEVDDKARAKEAEFGSETMRQIEKMVLLQTLDHLWREHLVTLEHLRQVIGFRSYGQRDPLNEYKSEGFHLFETMLASLREAVTGQLMHIQGVPEEEPEIEQVALPPMRRHSRRSVHGRGRAGHGRCGPVGQAQWPAERRAPLQTRKPPVARLIRMTRRPGARFAQRAVSVRLGQEIQALSRQARLKHLPLRRWLIDRLRLKSGGPAARIRSAILRTRQWRMRRLR
jgi:hypothetical protein